MARYVYEYKTRGEEVALSHAQRDDIYIALIRVLANTPEPIHPAAELEALDRFLRTVPRRDDRRTKAQKIEAARLVGLVEASTADALLDEVRLLLCEHIRGKSVGQKGQPKKQKRMFSSREMNKTIWIEVNVEVLLREGRPVSMSPNTEWWKTIQHDAISLSASRDGNHAFGASQAGPPPTPNH